MLRPLLALFHDEPRQPSRQVIPVALPQGDLVDVAVKRSARARRMTLRVANATGQVSVTLPQRASITLARAFVESHAGWIDARLAKLPPRIAFADGAFVPLRGIDHLIRHTSERRGTVIRVEGTEVEGAQVPELLVCGDIRHLERRLTDFMKREARADLERCAARHAATLGVDIARIRVADPTSRWGSCSASGSLAFSWRLIMAPHFVLDYVAAHEVAHRRAMHHGPAFWRILRDICPATDAAEAWLDRHGSALHRLGPQPGGGI